MKQHLPKSKKIVELPRKCVIQAFTKLIKVFVEVTKSLNFDKCRFEKFGGSCMNDILHITAFIAFSRVPGRLRNIFNVVKGSTYI